VFGLPTVSMSGLLDDAMRQPVLKDPNRSTASALALDLSAVCDDADTLGRLV